MTKLDKYKGLNEWSDEIIKELEDERQRNSKLIEWLKICAKRSHYTWSETGDYFSSDYCNEGQILCANNILESLEDFDKSLAKYSGPSKAGSGE